MHRRLAALIFALAALSAGTAHAAGASPYSIDGSSLGLVWILPFAGMLLSIALAPLLAPTFWHHHYGKVAIFWTLTFLVPYSLLHSPAASGYLVLHSLLAEYIPFIILLFTLYTIAGGIFIEGNIHGSPVNNTIMLACGTLLAGFVGTTGASMILIRPMIRANDEREHNTHVVIFFIFLVSNIGGSLTPLGDPPLFLGFLKGIDFFWPTVHLAAPMAFSACVLLAAFYVLDCYFYRFDTKKHLMHADPTPDTKSLVMHGPMNVLLLFTVIAVLVLCAVWKSQVTITVFHNVIGLESIVRDVMLLLLAGLSLFLTPRSTREGNEFSWGPILEVAKLFVAIFLTMIPVLAILQAGRNGAGAGLVALSSNIDGSPNNVMYFWLTGLLSSFLDNAPTYLVFFNLAGGDPANLMGPMAATLTAISCGAVFMGANSYIGNAPNFMVKAIAEGAGVRMPSFFAYCGWAVIFLIPTFILVSLIFF